jgi:hypothetical protein
MGFGQKPGEPTSPAAVGELQELRRRVAKIEAMFEVEDRYGGRIRPRLVPSESIISTDEKNAPDAKVTPADDAQR